MPTRILVAYIMIAAILAAGSVALLYLTRERRSWRRAARRYRRARKAAGRPIHAD